MAYTQIHRHLAFNSPFGEDVLLLRRMSGEEGISRLFRFDLEFLSQKPALNFSSIVGFNCTVRLRLVDGTDRYFNGVVSRFSQSGSSTSFSTYHAELVPWLWMLTRTSDCKIFQEMTIPEILEKVFDTYGFGDRELRLGAVYPVREYVVQYRETDFNFVSRLMEQYGIFYFFEHTDGCHKLILADSNGVLDPCPNQARARYQTTHVITVHNEDVVTAWTTGREARPGKASVQDFNFKTPAVNLQVNIDGVQPPPAGMKFEHYDYPGEYEVRDIGESLAKIRIQEDEAQTVVIEGGSNCRPFRSGYTFNLFEHPRGDFNQAYVLTRVRHFATDALYESDEEAGGFRYENQFTAIPKTISYRPARLTPKPVIQGLQTAIVAGPGEIFVDNFGRIKVQFHWDRFHHRGPDSSCWIRVAQAWAGKKWGAVITPRVGQEVLVGFLEGDPDQPLIVGTVYNGDQIQPYPLPDYKTRSVLRTDKTLGGGACHEFWLEDKAGHEEVYMHSSGELNTHVTKTKHETVEGEKHLEVYKDQIEVLKQNRHAKITGDDIAEVGGDVSKKVAGNLVLKVDGSHAEKVTEQIYLRAGMKVVIEADLELTISGPGGFIKIDPMGITIQGNLVLINSGGSPGNGSMKSPKSVKPIKPVKPPAPGSPDFNIFDPTNVVDPANATGSTPVGPGQPE